MEEGADICNSLSVAFSPSEAFGGQPQNPTASVASSRNGGGGGYVHLLESGIFPRGVSGGSPENPWREVISPRLQEEMDREPEDRA